VASERTQGTADRLSPLEPGATYLVTERRRGAGRFSWTSRFRVQPEIDQIKVKVAIGLVAAAGVSQAEINRVKARWKSGIEQAWSDLFALRLGNGALLPIRIKVRFHGPHFDHRVIVQPGSGVSHQLRWHLNDPPELAAHEFGHMLGAYDEYSRGALDPENPVLDPTGIMTANPVGAKVKARHFEPIRSWFSKRTGEEVRVVPLEGH
jgi:hypothetical protein